MKVWTISLAYMDAEIISESIARYYETKAPGVETVHALVDQHWPVGAGLHRAKLRKIAAKYGLVYLDPGKNLGLHHGFNWALSQFSIPDNAMVIGYDPDSYPVTHGWDLAMAEVFVARPSVCWLSLWHQHAQRQVVDEKAEAERFSVAGHQVFRVGRAVMNSVCGWRMGWLRACGGLTEGNEFYGGLEVAMWNPLQKFGGEWVFLPEFQEQPHFQDRMNPFYREWKWAHAHERTTKDDFATWLTRRG